MKTQRWVHVVIGGLLGAAAVTGVGVAQAGSTSGPSSFVPIVPCRLADTRSDTAVGAQSEPISGGDEVLFQVTGSNGNCSIPSTATGIAANITFDRPTAAGYLTVFPADAPRPSTSNLNWTPDSAPTPNQVTVKLSADGAIKVYNSDGSIDLIIDIVGYYQPAGSVSTGADLVGPAGPPGPAGATGPAGAPGPTGPRGVSSWDTIPSGRTVTGVEAWEFTAAAADGLYGYTTDLPATAPVTLSATSTNFSAGDGQALDADPTCTGSVGNPTAPAGKLCVYLDGAINAKQLQALPLDNKGFLVMWSSIVTGAGVVEYVWAYTAP